MRSARAGRPGTRAAATGRPRVVCRAFPSPSGSWPWCASTLSEMTTRSGRVYLFLRSIRDPATGRTTRNNRAVGQRETDRTRVYIGVAVVLLFLCITSSPRRVTFTMFYFLLVVNNGDLARVHRTGYYHNYTTLRRSHKTRVVVLGNATMNRRRKDERNDEDGSATGRRMVEGRSRSPGRGVGTRIGRSPSCAVGPARTANPARTPSCASAAAERVPPYRCRGAPPEWSVLV